MATKSKAQIRMEMLEKISEQTAELDRNYRTDMGLTNDPVEATPIVEENPDPVAEEAKKEDSSNEVVTTTVQEVVPGKQKFLAKVDGQEEEIEIESLISSYQKNRHAEKRMEEAALREKELKLKERELEMQRQQMLDMYSLKMKELEQGQAQSAKQAETIPPAGDSLKKAVSSLFGGEEEQAAQSLDEAIEAKVRATLERRLGEEATKIRAEAEKAAIESVAKANSQQRWLTAITQAQSQVPELFQDQDLASLWETKLRSFANEGSTPEEAAKKANEAMSRFMPSKEVKEEQKGFRVSDDELRIAEAKKAEAKRFSVDGKAVAVSGSKQKDEDRELTQSEIIAQMQASRHRIKPRA